MMTTTPAPRKFIFDTSDKKNVQFNNGYYSLILNTPVHCSKISVLSCTMVHSFYNIDYYNNEVILTFQPLLQLGGNGETSTKIYLRTGHYKTIAEITDELIYQLINNLENFTNENIQIVLNQKTYKLLFRIVNYQPFTKFRLTFTNSFRVFGFNQNESIDLERNAVKSSTNFCDIVHNPAIYFRSGDLHTHTINNTHTTNIFFRLPVSQPYMNWITYNNNNPEVTFFNNPNGTLSQLTITVTDYEGKEVLLNGGDFKIEFIVS